VLLKVLQEREVGALVATFEYILKIPNRLMGVKQQRQMEFGRHGDVPGLQCQSYREGCGF
jgi:hypothetical protein